MNALDSSALLAFIFDEPGARLVEPLLPAGLLSTINAAEVLGKLVVKGQTPAVAAAYLRRSPLEIVPFNQQQAEMVAELLPRTKDWGLSLGDRACIALAKIRGCAVLTADRAWADIPDLGVPVKLIR